jgi:hypothetical protein
MLHDTDKPRDLAISIAFGKCLSWRLPESISSPMIRTPMRKGSEFTASKCVRVIGSRQATREENAEAQALRKNSSKEIFNVG